ncbi:spermatogenesis associated 2-like [Dunckerocampus dactyliophorus]|uniref:spermatogenesis associated 2-like n=1 Tax=Dunckerocampus dactyliophorus TaxID=161453 RepID=UPI0024063E4B|nr:spermatogenesis associated 2-like [Dunckerocampus dactyliophorus]XP_054631431.1 spermatogenesis associated 2-like [Dunckerocampus dactyliophorus]XP_054631432.1 spermatogenesis associated 2-like [Dunckerocampus dactyliophorus]
MSIFQERAKHLVAAYGHVLEQQIVKRGSYLACGNEELWKQAEELLREENAQQAHCLGLETLKVMEESLRMEAASTKTQRASSGKHVKARGGLQGLGKAFEVLEQAALNLYLGPWREEYKEVKMYSGMFTHYIKPVLSATQIEKLFGLLGYQYSTRREQLQLQSLRVGPNVLEDLLRLSCAFFLARCECRLLLAALEKGGGDAQWELCVVRERQRGHSLKVALDNTKRTMGVKQPLMESDGESDVDLYTDKQVNGGQRVTVVHDDDSPHMPARAVRNNGPLSFPSSREHICISTLNCQLASASESEPFGRSSSSVGRHIEESVDADLQPRSLQADRIEAESSRVCSCLRSPRLHLNQCVDCDAFHDTSCATLLRCSREGHQVRLPVKMKEVAAASNVSPTLSSSTAMSALSLYDKPKSLSLIHQPISYHDCCDLTRPDPQLACLNCRVFHAASCDGISLCQIQHKLKELARCGCGRPCTRKPMVLCRYCANEYCKDCWYRSPFTCACGQTLDQVSSV